MTQEFFRTQLTRLRTRFGERNVDQEFVQLVWREVHDMSEASFKRFCDVLIGSRSANKPPLLSEFREARMNEQKLKFDNDVKAATQMLKRQAPEEMRKHMRQVLSRDFGAVESITDALEIARLRRRMSTDDNDKEPA